MPQPSELHLPADMHYGCVRCGRSCRAGWDISVEPDEAASIRARDPDALRKAGVADPTEPVVPSRWRGGAPAMRMTSHGHCAMLGADNLCALHKLFGEPAKPSTCRTFPYRFTETPRGTFAGLSFACTAVLGNEGPALADQRPAIEETLRGARARRDVQQAPDLAAAIPLSWEQYFAIEDDLAALLRVAPGEPPLPIGERLLMQYLYLHLLARLIREARRQTASEMAGPEANDQPLAVLRRQVHDGGQPFAMLRRMSARGKCSPLLRRSLLGFVCAVGAACGRHERRLRAYATAMGGYFGFALGRGNLVLPGHARPVPQSQLERIRFDPARPELNALLSRYFSHRLFRKDLLAADTIQSGLQFQLLHWGLIQWHAAALAVVAEKDEVGLDELKEALRIVERDYVLHSPLDEFLARMPRLRMLLDRLFEQPRYAITMARG